MQGYIYRANYDIEKVMLFPNKRILGFVKDKFGSGDIDEPKKRLDR
jgi:hypothetical protein